MRREHNAGNSRGARHPGELTRGKRRSVRECGRFEILQRIRADSCLDQRLRSPEFAAHLRRELPPSIQTLPLTSNALSAHRTRRQSCKRMAACPTLILNIRGHVALKHMLEVIEMPAASLDRKLRLDKSF